jgi:hypothetical protein
MSQRTLCAKISSQAGVCSHLVAHRDGHLKKLLGSEIMCSRVEVDFSPISVGYCRSNNKKSRKKAQIQLNKVYVYEVKSHGLEYGEFMRSILVLTQAGYHKGV